MLVYQLDSVVLHRYLVCIELFTYEEEVEIIYCVVCKATWWN